MTYYLYFVLFMAHCRLLHARALLHSAHDTPSSYAAAPDARAVLGCCRATHLFMHNIFGAECLSAIAEVDSQL
jgi:hypothetical protein